MQLINTGQGEGFVLPLRRSKNDAYAPKRVVYAIWTTARVVSGELY
jgi:hypothetical protein